MDNGKPFGRLWQAAMIGLAKSPAVKNTVQNLGPARALAGRFVAGETSAVAVRKAALFSAGQISTSFFFLGEYITDLSRVDRTLRELDRTLVQAQAAGLELHTSIDPTQAGLMQSASLCRKNLETLARRIQTLGRGREADVLMMDMEDAGVTQATLDIFFELRRQGLPLAITLQACLKRTPEDLARAARQGAMIRLVKGAFAEDAAIAHRPGPDTDRAFFCLARTLLSAESLAAGTCPVFATHDHRLINAVIDLAGKQGVSPDAFEFEMLYGVRPGLQEHLAGRGYRVRVYLPFGRDFWPYSVRRIGENPKNIRFFLLGLRRSSCPAPKNRLQ